MQGGVQLEQVSVEAEGSLAAGCPTDRLSKPIIEEEPGHEAAQSFCTTEGSPALGQGMTLDAAAASSNVSNESFCLFIADQSNVSAL